MKWSTTAPSNIALIKYMGKTDLSKNLPANASLSYTLDSLTTKVELQTTDKAKDQWQPFKEQPEFKLNQKAQARFLEHLQFLKDHFQYTGNFIVSSKNNFPLGCGLASSASSFAALTKCAVMALSELTNTAKAPIQLQAMLSRQGSGSSCRSFFSPWAHWHANSVEEIKLPYEKLLHQVIVLSDKEKTISSSLAHNLVTTSPAFDGRVQRAEQRLELLIAALNNNNWDSSFQHCWDEFIDMHNLFQTSSTPFDYMTDDCRALLKTLQQFWHKHGNGPIVTMDAGPNIHILYQTQDLELQQKFQQEHLQGKFNVI